MSFFQSEMVQEELKEIERLQQEVFSSMFTFGKMSKVDQINHINDLESLLDKQRVMMTRLSLSDDPAAKKMKLQIMQGAKEMGLPDGVDMSHVFNNMYNMVAQMRKHIDSH
tara:strand:+ start:196 stop:528 length:333 start_codon:yes stop_codon:yes gene_type:complete